MSFILHLDVKRLIVSLVVVLTGAALLAATGTAQAAIGNGDIAFKSSDGSDSDIFAVDPFSGAEPIELTSDPDNLFGDEAPAYSPDGARIAFQSNRSERGDNKYDIWIREPDGTLHNLTNISSERGSAENPAWSPDGARIVFNAHPGSKKDDIYVMDVTDDEIGDEDNISAVAHDRDNKMQDRSPSWSPDGSRIVFSSKSGDGDECSVEDGAGTEDCFDIHVVNADGTAPVELTGGQPRETNYKAPAWSPDGERIAYHISPDDGKASISVTDPTGATHRSLTHHSGRAHTNPAWSPDGSMVALSANLNGSDNDNQIYAIDSDPDTDDEPKMLAEKVGSAYSQPTWQAIEVADDEPSPGPGPGTPPAPGAPPLAGPVSVESLLFKLTSPKLKRSKAKRVKRAALYRYIKRGFKGKVSGYRSLRASLVRVVNRRAKGKAKRKAKRKKVCYTLARKRTSCGKTSRKGISIKAAGTGSTFKYKPTGKSKRQLKRLKRGKRIRRGLYQLTFKAKPKAGGRTKTFRYRLKVR